MKKYISQDDAEFVAEWYNLVNKLNTGIISEQIKELFENLINIELKLIKLLLILKIGNFILIKKEI